MSSAKRRSSFLKEARKLSVQSEVTSDAILTFLQSLDCPRSLTVWMLFKYKEHAQLADLEFDPLNYRDVEGLSDAYCATKFLSKFKGLSLDYDLDEVALLKFRKFEGQCRQTNRRFRNLGLDPLYTGSNVWLHNEVKRKISKILGDFSFEELVSSCNWGPGATTLIKARDASSTNKFQHEAGITRDLYALFPNEVLSGVYPLWHSHLLEIGFPNFQVGNKVVTVPKDATTNRVIAIEPGINLWFQSAIGSIISRRLLRIGIDLQHQSINQNLAREGSIDRSLTTIDFSSASDSISREIVFELIPQRWFSLLDSARSRFGQQGSDWVEWEKFSSMGNGFTFPLQSLIFYAMAICCVEFFHTSPLSARENRVSVYGDDVIIPTGCLDLFSDLSKFYGFTINVKKSHSSSFFRESCGAHFISGSDVKPIYLKDSLSDVTSVYRLANAVRRLAHRRMSKLACDARFRPVFRLLVDLVPKSLRLWIPETLGDGGFISNFDEATPIRARTCIEGYYVWNVVFAAKSRESDVVGLLLARLWVPSLQAERNTVPLRGRTKLRVTRSLVPQWYDLGPWI